jgi:hypothetical protein
MPASKTVSISASAVIQTGACYVHSVYVEAGDDTATAALADALVAAQTRKLGCRAQATNQQDRVIPGLGAYFGTGIYSTISGTTPIVEITYSLAG